MYALFEASANPCRVEDVEVVHPNHLGILIDSRLPNPFLMKVHVACKSSLTWWSQSIHKSCIKILNDTKIGVTNPRGSNNLEDFDRTPRFVTLSEGVSIQFDSWKEKLSRVGDHLSPKAFVTSCRLTF